MTKMEVTIFVLWIYFAEAWAYVGFPMTPGWASIAVFVSGREDCEEAATHIRVHPALPEHVLCLPTGVMLKPASKIYRGE